MNTIFRFFLRILPVIYIICIWIQSSLLNPEKIGQFSNKITSEMVIIFGVTFELAHLVEFGILYLFIVFALLTYGNLTKKKEMLACIISVGYSLVDEIHQLFVPFRSFSIIDLVKDIIGVWVVWYIINKFYYKNNSSKLASVLRRISGLQN